VALRVLPARPRDELRRVYAYARFVDDVGDEAPGDRLAMLDVIAADVAALPGGPARLPIVRNLAPLVRRGVPIDPFLDLVAANRVDQHTATYADFAALMDYCRLSASPVGRIVLHVAGAATVENVADSDAVCNALQVLEHCQDVREDALAGRVYLPADDLQRAAATPEMLRAPTTSHAVRQAVAANVGRAVDMLGHGPRLVHRLRGWARVAVAGYVAGGFATARALQRAEYDVLARDVRPAKLETAGRALVLVAGIGGGR
jgi:squalene synthase HpnC